MSTLFAPEEEAFIQAEVHRRLKIITTINAKDSVLESLVKWVVYGVQVSAATVIFAWFLNLVCL